MLKKLLYVPVLTVSAQMAIAGETSTENGFSITPTLGAGFAHLRTENPSFSANADDMNYTEMYIKPGAIVDYSFSSDLNVFAGGSFVSAKTTGDGDPGFYTEGGDGRTDLDELYAGIRSGNWTLSAGRQNYMIGTGFIVMDGDLDMGDDGAYWTAPRTAFKASGVLAYDSDAFSAQVFSLGTDRDIGSYRLTGINIDYPAAGGAFGAMITKVKSGVSADETFVPKNGMVIYNLRALDVTIPGTENLKYSGEYALQQGEGDGIKYDASAWYSKFTYSFADTSLTPSLSYRYVYYSGDDDLSDDTRKDWDPTSKGYIDWGTWLVGEIAGSYLIYNSNQITQTVQATASLLPNVIIGALYNKFTLDEKNHLGVPVNSKDFAAETNIYVDWYPNQKTYVSLVYALTQPGKAAEEFYGDDADFSALELYATYRY
ncbi:MAG: hypothetical protein CMI13_05600 [Oleibacter sp.]|nr:hypothetical protein [Thalassolituus sp.]|tara:strand:+ start:375 stop:1661 length:1287 start_codon:yes stop_codon:yes gene_type:complete